MTVNVQPENSVTGAKGDNCKPKDVEVGKDGKTTLKDSASKGMLETEDEEEEDHHHQVDGADNHNPRILSKINTQV